MSESILRNLKAFGLTPWQLVLGAAIAYGWVNSLMPMPAEVRQLSESVSKMGQTLTGLSTDVKIHSVLINQMTELNNEMKSMRRELSTIEGRLAHATNYRSKSSNEP